MLDDIQWMELDARNILNNVIETCKNTSFIASTREDISTIKKHTFLEQTNIQFLEIKELNHYQDIVEKVSAIFKCNNKCATELAHKLMSKTHGNLYIFTN